jgi:hypothetical protein
MDVVQPAVEGRFDISTWDSGLFEDRTVEIAWHETAYAHLMSLAFQHDGKVGELAFRASRSQAFDKAENLHLTGSLM